MRKFISQLFFLLITLISFPSQAQTEDLARRLFNVHETYREVSLTQRRFKQKDILPLISKRQGKPLYQIEQVGESFEGRAIQMIKVGTGKRKVLLWSQMHGDEPTATMATFDIFNFLEGKNDGFDSFRKDLLENTTLYFVPMLNPDGAERYQRRTMQGIDMNRDAAARQTPEAVILKGLVDKLKPDFGFNLHDQSPRYSAGRSPKVATISFLATSYDYELSINPVRERSMQLIVGMNKVLQKYIPGQVARYSDDHEPRGFGDNVQKWGTTLVLIESGGYVGDPEKQYIRQLNFMAILSALGKISDNSLTKENREEYYDIPENGRWVYDLVVRNATVKQSGKSFTADLGINRSEVNYANASKFFYYSKIEDFGDLHPQYGSQELDATGLTIEKGKVHPTTYKNVSEISKLNAKSLLREGYTYVRLAADSNTRALGLYFTTAPLHVLRAGQPVPTGTPGLGATATFILKKAGKVKYAVINGFVHDLDDFEAEKGQGIIE
ncbi:M14 family zinc carboxypeptidase [Dyadobacter pollutisoli]|uniref:M14 family zinc carboxypeptidase n=1 Tax=Dyadobacter pollutisoli TaxID=2910158 RepID=A0A9E8N7X8_9BACT|nr:M14 family zinc carboxypeptidase [Dyadobacter pollutisoli]WAC11540.1 M14 family zinc carboxypeptidase [Dyadobacter pollutisoli]